MTEDPENLCKICKKTAPKYHLYCSWNCHVEDCRRDGYVEICPNGLPVMSVPASGLLLEHEHGDHPDYIFPVDIEFLGTITEEDKQDYEAQTGKNAENKDDVRKFLSQTHALIYTDGSAAVTLHECTYATWYVRTGKMIGWSLASTGDYKLSDESLKKIVVHVLKINRSKGI